MNNRPLVVDLFSGVGGLSLGFEQAGFDVAINVEIEDLAGRYAQYNFPHSNVLYGEEKGDVRKFNAKIVSELGYDINDVFMVVGGPPCQGFSIAGKKRKDDPLNELVLEFARVVKDIKPKAFLMENVPGLKTSDSPMLGKALKLLEKEYEIAGPETLRAWEYGVPQMRQRVFILGIRKDLKISPSFPSVTHARPNEQGALFLQQCPTCWDAIQDIPPVDEYVELLSGDRVELSSMPTSNLGKYLREIKKDPLDFSRKVKWDKTSYTNLRRTQHGESLLQRLKGLDFGQADKVSGIRRLDPNDISTTIRAGTTKARGSWSAPRPLHPYQDRVITTRECARIQTFPDWFFFHPVKWHGNRMVGNAVPPHLARSIAYHIREIFGLSKPIKPSGLVKRNDHLVSDDIDSAIKSGYENRNVSQKVVSWGKNRKSA